MTLNNLLIQLEDASVDSSSEIYEWLENHHIDRDEAIALHDEIELAGKVEEEWEVYKALVMYIDYGREWDEQETKFCIKIGKNETRSYTTSNKNLCRQG